MLAIQYGLKNNKKGLHYCKPFDAAKNCNALNVSNATDTTLNGLQTPTRPPLTIEIITQLNKSEVAE